MARDTFDALRERGRAAEAVWALGEQAKAIKAMRVSMGLESGETAMPVSAPKRAQMSHVGESSVGRVLRAVITGK